MKYDNIFCDIGVYSFNEFNAKFKNINDVKDCVKNMKYARICFDHKYTS